MYFILFYETLSRWLRTGRRNINAEIEIWYRLTCRRPISATELESRVFEAICDLSA